MSDTKDLWNKVATVFSERADEGDAATGSDVRRKLAEIVHRRNKIAHEYDQDPDKPSAKLAIDAAVVTQSIDWIEQMAAAILVVLDSE